MNNLLNEGFEVKNWQFLLFLIFYPTVSILGSSFGEWLYDRIKELFKRNSL